MKVSLLSLALSLLASAASADVLVDWDFSSLTNSPAGTLASNPLLASGLAGAAPGVTVSALTAEKAQASYHGLEWSDASAATGELNLRYFDGDLSNASTNNDGVSDNYLAFTLTPSAGTLDVTRLSVSVWRNGNGAPASYAMEVVVDGGTPQPFGLAQLDGASGDAAFDWFQFDGAVSASSSLEVRFRPVAAPGGLGTGNLHINGLKVEANTRPPPSAGPNVLFLIADDLTSTVLGCYNHPLVQTPNIDSLAARGLVFDRAYCQYPVCGYSRSSLMTGMYPDRIAALGGGETNWDGAIGSHSTLPEHFRQNGYTSARVSKIYHMRIPGDITAGASGPDHAPSWDLAYNVQAPEWMSTGSVGHYTTETVNTTIPTTHYGLNFGAAFYAVETNTSGAEQADAITSVQGRAYLDSLQSSSFFLALGFVRPHVPLVAPSSYFSLYPWAGLPLAQSVPNDLADIPGQGVFWNEPSRGPLNDSDRRKVLQAYYASVTYMDEKVGEVLQHLRDLGLEDSTYVVFTSDHGYHLGEHSMWQKLSLHEESAKVPLIIAGPGIPTGRRDSLVEFVDVYPTLADYAGLPIPPECQGVSLRPAIENPAVQVRSSALSSVSNGDFLRTADWAYMRYAAGGEELYDMRPGADPLQFQNLAGDAAYAAELDSLRTQLDVRLAAAASGGGVGHAYCYGTGTGTPCPCGGWAVLGEGCVNSSGAGARILPSGSLSVTSDTLRVNGTGLLTGQPALLFVGENAVNSGNGTPFGDGLRCAGGNVTRLGVRTPSAAGTATWGPSLSILGGWGAGDTRYFQVWYRDPAGGACASGFNLSNGLELTFLN